MTDPIDEEMLGLFAATADARELAQAESAAPTVPAGRIAAYARRDDPVIDLAMERLLRGDARARHIYQMTLAGATAAVSQLAIAASGEKVLTRSVGPHRLEIIEDAGGVVLILHLAGGETVPNQLEVRAADGEGQRIRLSKPVRGIVQLPLDKRDPALSSVHDLIVRPDTAIFLLT